MPLKRTGCHRRFQVRDPSNDEQASASAHALAPALGIDEETAKTLDAAVREQTRRTRKAAGLI